MIGKLIGSGQLGKLASFASPAFFDVMPARALWAKARQLYGRSRDGEAFRRAVAERANALRDSMPQLRLDLDAPRAPRASDAEREARASCVVELYFRQLFEPGPCLLDLRAQAFRPAEGSQAQLLWQPAPWFDTFSDEFLGPLREVYRGFYTGDEEGFRRGLQALSLEHSEDVFRTHFGHGTTRFETQEFIDSFHRVFVRCKRAGTALHPDFLSLGIYLAALYDHIEELGVAVDVNEVFARATNTPAAHAEVMHA